MTATSNLLDADDPPVLGANPLVGLTRAQLAAALARLARHVGTDPALVLASALRTGGDLIDVALGRVDVQPAKGDKRFTHPAWEQNLAYRRLLQTYLVEAAALMRLVDDVDLDAQESRSSRGSPSPCSSRRWRRPTPWPATRARWPRPSRPAAPAS